ncbi:hypothetical protein Tco_0801032 [Tanacetum coccineum]|uniref:Uncharacterized protein n=1 Tax=Tanacetum coccineum TaxID=301880 RepID=A0ABQ4ZUT3_9ASTR
MLLVDCTEPGQTREDSVSRIPQKAGNTHAGAHGSGDLCLNSSNVIFILRGGHAQHEVDVRHPASSRATPEERADVPSVSNSSSKTLISKESSFQEGECEVSGNQEWGGYDFIHSAGIIFLTCDHTCRKKARKSASLKSTPDDEEKPTLDHIFSRPCALMARAICARILLEEKEAGTGFEPANLQIMSPDELTIPLPRFSIPISKKSHSRSDSDFELEAIVKEDIILAGESDDLSGMDWKLNKESGLASRSGRQKKSILFDNQEKKRRSTYSTTAFRRSNEEKNFSVRREAECSVIEAEDKEKGEREAILIVLVPPKGSVLDLVVKNLTETIFFALRNRSN